MGGSPDDFPTLSNGRATNNEIWALLAHPVYGLGALNSAIMNLDGRLGELGLELGTVKTGVSDNTTSLSELEERVPFTPDEAKEQRAAIDRGLARSQRRRTILNKVADKMFERATIVMAAFLVLWVTAPDTAKAIEALMQTIERFHP